MTSDHPSRTDSHLGNPCIHAVADMAFRRPCSWSSESDLQEHLSGVLGTEWEREYVSGSDRYDLRHPSGLVVEVKTDGSHAAVLEQLVRYAYKSDVTGIVLATTKPRHCPPEEINGKPVAVARLWKWGLL